MSHLSEQQVRQLGLGFLKSYYRNRSRVGYIELSSDMRGLGGIKADGYLSFLQDGGKRFEATLEATSYHTRNELRYALQQTLLTWDAVAVASIVLVLLLALSQYFQIASVPQIGLLWVIFWLLVCFLIAFLTYRFLAYGLDRYRYIYAVEQFRRYRADEQWIAMSEAVFSDKEDPYFRELRQQCTRYGIGLLWISADKEVQMILAASRSRGDADHRRRISWFGIQGIGRRDLGRRLRRGLGLNVIESYTGRYKRGYNHQLAIALFSWVLIGGLLYLGWRQRPVRYLTEKEFKHAIAEQLKEPVSEPFYYVVDTPFLVPYARVMEPYLSILSPQHALGVFSIERTVPRYLAAIPGIFVGIGADTIAQFPCDRLPPLQSSYYLLRESRFEELGPALKRISRLRASGWEANGLSMECIHAGLHGYVVFVGSLYKGEKEAAKVWSDLRQGRRRSRPSVDIVPVASLVLNE